MDSKLLRTTVQLDLLSLEVLRGMQKMKLWLISFLRSKNLKGRFYDIKISSSLVPYFYDSEFTRFVF